MTVNEIITKIQENRNKKFYLQMKDYWNSRDYDYGAELTAEYIALCQEYKNLTGEDYVDND